ncbi:hypothetical protein [Fodinicola feengrottensis]|uniref:Uncharacterized protein n=1 Tax=Fodinicola feengrottensis TaxID=435914 RepID=A0ABN2IB70_9ACTN|nr:hypothetical protein [Fodinicola feengrottensis]
MPQYKVDWEGKTYDFDPEDIDVKQGIAIQYGTGMTLKAFNDGIQEVDVHAWQALMWLMKNQNGEQCNIQDLNFKVNAFSNAINAAERQYTAELIERCRLCDDDGLIGDAACSHDPKGQPDLNASSSTSARTKASETSEPSTSSD